MDNNLWEIVERDGTVTPIKPEHVALVQRRWDDGQPIHTTNRSIPAQQIKAFQKTERVHSSLPLLEAASRAFNEPIMAPDDSEAVVARWVKKHVTQQQYAKHYGAIPAYRRLAEDRGMIVVAFRLPVHTIDTSRVDYCSDEDIHFLTRA